MSYCPSPQNLIRNVDMYKKVMAGFGVLVAVIMLLTSATQAQTAFPPANGGNQASSGTQTPIPLSPRRAEAISQNQEGTYPPLERSVLDARPQGGQIQEYPWSYDDNPQLGFTEAMDCYGCVHKVLLREHMVSAITLPSSEVILHNDFGDDTYFEGATRAPNVFVVRPIGFGMDTSLLLHTKSGRVYSFYLRVINDLAEQAPDIAYSIRSSKLETTSIAVERETIEQTAPNQDSMEEAEDKSVDLGDLSELALSAQQNSEDGGGDNDFTKLKIDPSTIHGLRDFEIWGSDATDLIKPQAIYRDDKFTFIQYDPKTWNAKTMPAAFVTRDGIDGNVNTRMVGTTLVVERQAELITLKYGTSYLCIKYTGRGA